MIDWLMLIYANCTSGVPPVHWREIALVSNIATAIAYFWIPAVMAVVFARWREELPYRWLWVGFVLFITACGLSHVMHALHVLRSQTAHSWPELAVLAATASISLVTAAGFTYLLPRILSLASPAESKRRLERAIACATTDLQRSLDHQRLLLREVHHRVKNNLQVTASLVNLHLRRSSEQPGGGLRDLRDRITALAAVHGQLQDVGNSVLMAKPLVLSLAASMESGNRTGSDGLVVEGDDFEVPLDHAASFALILHEVLANAFEHGTIDGGQITVTLGATDGTRAVSVTDHGPGMETPADADDGIGIVLVKALAVQLGARISWERLTGGGTCFSMEFETPSQQSRIPPSTERQPNPDLAGV